MENPHKYILKGLNFLISSSRKALWTEKSDLPQTGMRSIISRIGKAQQDNQRRQKETSLPPGCLIIEKEQNNLFSCI